MVLQKSFCGIGLKFSEPQARRLNNDVGDHVDMRKLTGGGSRCPVAAVGALECLGAHKCSREWPECTTFGRVCDAVAIM